MNRFIEFFMQFWIVLSVICFSLDTLPNLDENSKFTLDMLEYISVGIFTIEYVARAITSKPTSKYCLSFFGIIDLLAILPFYLGASIDLRSIRAIRLLRVIRLFKLMRYNQALVRLSNAFASIKDELVIFVFITAIMIYVAAVGIYHFEHDSQPENFGSVFDSMWWALSTLTTVGYGDIYPKTVGGKVFTGITLVIGLGIVAIPSGLIASAITRTEK